MTGSYTGNGVDNRNITGIGFQPDIVIIKYDGNTDAIIRTANMPADRAKRITDGSLLGADWIQQFLADGFQVGTLSHVNQSGRVYQWIAMKAGVNVTYGSYTGNGVDNRNITGVGFQPDWLMTMGNGQEDIYRPGPLGGDASYTSIGTNSLTNRIQGWLADGFQLGSDANVNENARTYYWIAFDAGSKVKTGTYTGNGADSRNITGLGITPAFAWIKRLDTTQSPWRTNIVAGDRSLFWGATGPGANSIQSLLADGFQVGTDAGVNHNGQTYYYIAAAP